MMKKTYQKPVIAIIQMELTHFVASSSSAVFDDDNHSGSCSFINADAEDEGL